MNEPAPDQTPSSSSQARLKQAACLVCRRSKIRCDWSPGEGRCKRCLQINAECVRPDFHPGRQKGIKNKRVGLDKAIHQVEQAVKRLRTGDPKQSSEDGKAISHLLSLLSGDLGPENPTSGLKKLPSVAASRPDECSDLDRDEADEEEEDASPADRSTDVRSMSMSSFVDRSEESMAVDDAENPLQLLARASYFSPPEDGRGRTVPTPQKPRSSHAVTWSNEHSSRLTEFFSSARVNLDVGDDVDPITLGLVTDTECDSLLAFFHSHLAHTRWGMDPRIYTVRLIRSRSAFLLTSILATATLYMPEAGALSKRLFNHIKFLVQRIVARGHKSVEIVLAFMVNVPWMFPGKHSTDDETCRFISMANTIAIDLSLHKVVVPVDMRLEPGSHRPLARGECIDARTALMIDGYSALDPWSERAKLLLRSRERCWISLFVLERGMSLARGRPFIVPITRSIKDCDTWHRSPLADPMDGHVVSVAVLRRDLDGLFSTVRALCDGSQNPTSDGSLVAQSIESAIERFFDSWFTEWGVSIGTGPQRRLPPYVEILVTHTRLSGYANVINHPTAPLQVRQFFRTAGLSSALNVLRVAIQGETQLQSMPNNTAIMISFAACFALTLSAHTADSSSSLTPSIRRLIDEAAGVLERIGTITPHRNGLSTLYGNYLRQIVQRSASETGNATPNVNHQPHHHRPQNQSQSPARIPITHSGPAILNPPPPRSVPTASDQTHHNPQLPPLQHHHHQPPPTGPPLPPPPSSPSHQQQQQQQILWPEPLPLSTMSNDQILQVLNQPGNEFQPSFDGLTFDDMNNFGWLHWPEFGV